ncbi:MAG TPA: oligosaccharide flippase family protein [Chitinophagaceae bacterium]|nr:oligosaccharide flippase family protein [Chitinophagaceae bacterium]
MKLQRQLIIYFGATAVNAILSFVIATLLTHEIAPQDYGRIYLYSAFLNFMTPFITAGILAPLSVEYFKRSHDSYSRYFTNAQLIPVLSLCLFTVLCFLFQNPLAHFLKVKQYWIWVLPLTAWCIMIYETTQMLTRNNNKPWQFAFFAVGKTGLEMLLTILFVLAIHWSWQGRLLSAATAPLLLAIVSIWLFRRWRLIEKQIDWKLVKQILIISSPFIFERLGVFIMNSSGQYFIDNMVVDGTAEVGLYSLGNTIAQILFLVVLSMNYAYQPHLFKKLSDGLKNRLHKTTIWYILAVAAASGLLVIGIPVLFRYFLGAKYAGAEKYALLLVIGCFMWGVYNAFQAYLIYIHKKGLILSLAIVGMFVSMLTNYFLVKKYGTVGAAYSSILTYTLMAVSCFLMVQKYFIKKKG